MSVVANNLAADQARDMTHREELAVVVLHVLVMIELVNYGLLLVHEFIFNVDIYSCNVFNFIINQSCPLHRCPLNKALSCS